VLETIARTYSGFTPLSWLQSKWAALQVLLVGGGQCGFGEHAAISSTVDGFRSRDFFYVLPSLLLLVAGAAIARMLPRTSQLPVSAATPWLVSGVLSVLIGTLLMLDCYINHAQSYQSLLSLHLGLLMVLARHRNFFRAWVAVIVVYGMWVWVLDPIRYYPQLDLTALVVGALALCLLPAVLRPLQRRAAGVPGVQPGAY